MARTSKYSQEVRERAVRMVFEHRGDYASEWEAMGSIASKIGCTTETLRKWVRQAWRLWPRSARGARGGTTKETEAFRGEYASSEEDRRRSRIARSGDCDYLPGQAPQEYEGRG